MTEFQCRTLRCKHLSATGCPFTACVITSPGTVGFNIATNNKEIHNIYIDPGSYRCSNCAKLQAENERLRAERNDFESVYKQTVEVLKKDKGIVSDLQKELADANDHAASFGGDCKWVERRLARCQKANRKYKLIAKWWKFKAELKTIVSDLYCEKIKLLTDIGNRHCSNCMRGDSCFVVSEASVIASSSEMTSEQFAEFEKEFSCSLWEAKK